MTLTQVWGSLLIFLGCPLLGGLPLIEWITYGLSKRKLSQVGTGNISVSAAFYHGGKLAGIVAVLSEASKGIIAVLLARTFFPLDPAWELIALIALVMGRYWMAKGAGTTNVFWGVLIHDWQAAILTGLIGGISFTIFRDRTSGRLVILFLLALILVLRHSGEPEYIGAAIALVALLAWIHQKIPDDLDLPSENVRSDSQKMFRFFQGNRAILTLDRSLSAAKVGQKAATLSQLKQKGYAVPDGWLLPAGDDPQPLIEWLDPSPEVPLVVRSSAIGEDSQTASAAGQYRTILNVTDREALKAAILDCQASYYNPSAVIYRRDRASEEGSMAVLVQKQVRGVFSGVAFSRDPVNPLNTAVAIEALPGDASRVVSGKITPERYWVDPNGGKSELNRGTSHTPDSEGKEAEESHATVQSSGDVPSSLIHSVAVVAREIEALYHGIPQDIEWTYDGEQLWILQARAIVSLQPIWTRKIAAEVIPGVIRPLTWSINRPLTCGVWGEIFSLVLGERAKGLDFKETATLHYQHAYFNATLLGEIFRRMGLPAESLEFLTRGAKFSKPSWQSTLRNLPGLFKLLQREWNLEKDFERDNLRYFAPTLQQLTTLSPSNLAPDELEERVDSILAVLKRATYYSILSPLSLALRQAVLKVPPEHLENSETPEIESMRSLAELATDARNLLPIDQLSGYSCPSLFAHLAEIPDGESILGQFDRWLERYGYLSEVATDISIPRWREDPRSVRALFTQYLFHPLSQEPADGEKTIRSGKTLWAQKRLKLKGRVTEVYSLLLAHLRWSFIALEEIWLNNGLLSRSGEIFFLKLPEIRHLIDQSDPAFVEKLPQILQQRQTQFSQSKELSPVPMLIYGSPKEFSPMPMLSQSEQRQLQGIGASAGRVEGRVKILRTLQETIEIDRQTILVVPYTDAGWTAILVRSGGIIAEVGGALSHGAIVAREYGIPAVMDVSHATHLLREGQRVRIDGQQGLVEILEGD